MLKKVLLSTVCCMMALCASAVEIVLFSGDHNLDVDGEGNLTRELLLNLDDDTELFIDYTLNGSEPGYLRLSSSWGNNNLPDFPAADCAHDDGIHMRVTENGTFTYVLTGERKTKMWESDWHGWDQNIKVSGSGLTIHKVYFLNSVPVDLDQGNCRFPRFMISKGEPGWKIVMTYALNEGKTEGFFRWASSYGNWPVPGFAGIENDGYFDYIKVDKDGEYTYTLTQENMDRLESMTDEQKEANEWHGWDSKIHIIGNGITVKKIERIRTFGTTTGIEEVAIESNDDSTGSVEYYTLYGVKVNNPIDGIYIRVQGNRASKVLIRQ